MQEAYFLAHERCQIIDHRKAPTPLKRKTKQKQKTTYLMVKLPVNQENSEMESLSQRAGGEH